MRLALHGVVVHGEHLLVVVLPTDGVRDFVDVDQFIDHDNQPAITGLDEEIGKQLEIVVPVVVADDDADAQLAACLGLGCVFAAEPFEDAPHGLIIALLAGMVVHGQQAREIEAVDHVLHGCDGLGDGLVYAGCEFGVVRRGHDTGFACERRGGIGLYGGDPPVEDERECPAFRPCFGGHVAHEFTVGGQALPFGALQAAFRGEVGVDHDEAAVHDVGADGLQEEAFAAAVSAFDEAECRSPAFDDVDVVEDRFDFAASADGDVGQADAGYDAAFEGVDDDSGDAFGDLSAWRSLPCFRTARGVGCRFGMVHVRVLHVGMVACG